MFSRKPYAGANRPGSRPTTPRVQVEWMEPSHYRDVAEITVDAASDQAEAPSCYGEYVSKHRRKVEEIGDREGKVKKSEEFLASFLESHRPYGSAPSVFVAGKVVVVRKKVVAYSTYEINDWKGMGGGWAGYIRILDFAVAPVHQLKGYGRILLNEILGEYVDNLGFSFHAVVHHENIRALKFFSAVGREWPNGPFASYTRGMARRAGAAISRDPKVLAYFANIVGEDEYLFLRMSDKFSLAPSARP